jgi:hypothetical protein
MAGVDYSGFAINFKTEEWTNMGYVRDGKNLISFHKTCDDEIEILLEPGGIAFKQHPGIAKYNEWWIVFGYTDINPREFLRTYLIQNKHSRDVAIFPRIIKKKQTV